MADVDDGSVRSEAGGTAGTAGAGRRRAAKRRRQKNDPDRTKRVNVRVTPDELAALTERAEAQGVTVPRFLLEAALALPGSAGSAGSAMTATQRLDALTELFAFQRTLGGIGHNLNQLAKHANHDGHFPDQAFDLRVQLMGVFHRIDELLDNVADPSYLAGPASIPGTRGAAGSAGGTGGTGGTDASADGQDEWGEALRGPLAGTDWEQ